MNAMKCATLVPLLLLLALFVEGVVTNTAMNMPSPSKEEGTNLEPLPPLPLPEKEEECPPNVPRINCMFNPCDVEVCPAYTDAECKPSYCGECNAKFYDVHGVAVDCTQKGTEEEEEEEEKEEEEECPPNVPRINCMSNPCDVEVCPAYTDAECKPSYCGECNAKFYDVHG